MLSLKSKLNFPFSRPKKEPSSNCIPSTTETLDPHSQVCLVCLHNTTLFSYLTSFSLILSLEIGGAIVDTYKLEYYSLLNFITYCPNSSIIIKKKKNLSTCMRFEFITKFTGVPLNLITVLYLHKQQLMWWGS
jgi:hypothetical protein